MGSRPDNEMILRLQILVKQSSWSWFSIDDQDLHTPMTFSPEMALPKVDKGKKTGKLMKTIKDIVSGNA